MGKKRSKSSRKGKKEWRANISTEDIDNFYEKSTKDALSGGCLENVPSESLFFVDKSRDLSIKRKIEKHREKIIHSDSILKRNAFVQPVPSSNQKKIKRKVKEVKNLDDVGKVGHKDRSILASGMVDIWNEKGEGNRKTKRMFKPSTIPAVEVEPPGCSYNPSFESHQDSLACAVAEEMQKIYRNDLRPERVPLTVTGDVNVHEEDIYFLDADKGLILPDDDDTNVDDFHENGDIDAKKSSSKTKPVTRVVRNKRARRKEQLKKEFEANKLERLSKEIDCLPEIIGEIAKEDEEKKKRHIRKSLAEVEKLKAAPPRLGKHKFQPAPVQVLLSEDITGSLRKLKGCCTLARDRFKSLEKRGLLVPTFKTGRK